jgi:integrase
MGRPGRALLRHACGYVLANAGHDTRALQAYLGHRNIQAWGPIHRAGAGATNGFSSEPE